MSTRLGPRERHHRWGQDGRLSVSVLALLCAAAVLASGCLRAQAKALPEVPLAMPAPPARVVEVAEPAPTPIVALPEEPARAAPLVVPPPPVRRSDTRSPESVKPETASDAQKLADGTPRTPPTTTLQTTTTQLEGQVDRQIRTVLAQAVNDLNRINAQTLNAEARTQFDIARRFVSQAEEALRVRNLVFASNLAEKASALAAQLAGR